MYCSYHQSNPARIACANCQRPLCTYCDHRIKGHPYCQDCIVLGIENLSRRPRISPVTTSRPIVAALCGLIPGLGAVYNRQNVKAIVHFVTTVGLFQLSEIRPLDLFFVLAGCAFYLYSIVDAFRTADRISRGEDPQADEAHFKQSLAKRASTLGVGMLTVGLFLLIRITKPFGFDPSLIRLLPVGLILLGGYLIVSHIKRSRGDGTAIDYAPNAPYPLFPVRSGTERGPQFSGRGPGTSNAPRARGE
jgi:TM2 domain-containing membrane protein YozV